MARQPGSLHTRFVRAVAAGPEDLRQFADWCEGVIAGSPRKAVLWLFYARALEELGDDGSTQAYRRYEALTAAGRSSEIDGLAKAARPRKKLRPSLVGPVLPSAEPISRGKVTGRPPETSNSPSSPAGTKPFVPPDAGRDLVLKRASELYGSGLLNESIVVLIDGLRANPGDRALLITAADTLRKAGRYTEAKPYYELVFANAKQSLGARVHYGVQLGLVCLKMNDIKSAKAVVNQLRQLNSRTLHVQQLQTRVEDYERGFDPSQGLTYGEETVDIDHGQMDLSESPLLVRDVTEWSFLDSSVRTLGSRLSVNDAERLLEHALSGLQEGADDRSPYFLDAAKAFSLLSGPPSHRSRLAYSRYAMARAQELTARFDDLLVRQPRSPRRLQTIRDSMLSYLREGMRLHTDVKHASELRAPVRNVLRLSMTNVVLARDITADILPGNQAFDQLRVMAFGGDRQLLITWMDTLLYLCSARPRAAAALVDGLKLDDVSRLARQNASLFAEVLSQCVEKTLNTKKPSQLLQEAARCRLEAIQQTEEYFARLRSERFNTNAPKPLLTAWADRPVLPGVLLPTDYDDFIKPLDAALGRLDGIERRALEERHAILAEVRRSLEQVEERAQSTLTYLGQTQVRELAVRWLAELGDAERRARQALQPELEVRLDPPYFKITDQGLEGRALIRNVGRAAATSFVLTVELDARSGENSTVQEEHFRELSAGQAIDLPLTLRFDDGQGWEWYRGKPLSLHTSANSAFSDSVQSTTEVTIDAADPPDFDRASIPWVFNGTPKPELFMGRSELIEDLVTNHFRDSFRRSRTLLLYGLTRTGKTSLRDYLAERLSGEDVPTSGGTLTRLVPIIVELDSIARALDTGEVARFFVDALDRGVKRIADEEDRHALVEAFEPTDETRSSWSDWEGRLTRMHDSGYTCVVLIDEFTQYRELAERRLIGPSFLSMLRTLAFSGTASFVLIGAFSLRNMLKSEMFGDAGQMVNVDERQIAQIDAVSARKLVGVFDDKLHFTGDATAEILRLSGCIPYFIQWVCRECAVYALKVGRRVLGAPDVNDVVDILVSGDPSKAGPYGMFPMGDAAFQNNLHTPSDPVEFDLLFGLMCDLTADERNPHGVALSELTARLGPVDKQLSRRFLLALDVLVERRVLEQQEGDGEPVYHLSVDLFRRYWYRTHHLDLGRRLNEFLGESEGDA